MQASPPANRNLPLLASLARLYPVLARATRAIQEGLEGRGKVPEIEAVRAEVAEALAGELKALSRPTDADAQAVFRAGCYALVCLADELILHGPDPWPGREWWRENPLESDIFHTRIGGEKVFRQIDSLIRRQDPFRAELAMLYLQVLALGFQGRYRNRKDQSPLFAYRRKLAELIFSRAGGDDAALAEGLRPAYAHTLSVTERTRLPSVKTWTGYLLAIVAGWVIVTTAIWELRTSPSRAAIEELHAWGDCIDDLGLGADPQSCDQFLPSILDQAGP